MRWCRTCVMPDTRPRIVFEDGQCNACRWAEHRLTIDYEARRKEFHELVKRKKRHPKYDCIVPFSGGKDSASIAHRLKYEEGLEPLLVCYGQLVWTDVGRRNFHRVADAGFDIFYWRVDQRVSRALARRFFMERGHVKQHYDAAVNSVPLLTGQAFDIPLIIFAEHGESEYGGLVLSEEHTRTRDLAEVLENQVGDDARNWVSDDISESDLWPYCYPEELGDLEAHYYSYYFPWDIYENARFCREKIGFETAKDYPPDPEMPQWWGRSSASFEGFDSIDDHCDRLYLYMMRQKFGFGRAARMASRLIQRGHLTREEGVSLTLEYDAEFPWEDLNTVSEYLGLTIQEIMDICKSHTNTDLFEGVPPDGMEWKLKCPPE